MKELITIVNAYKKLNLEKQQAAIATVVKVRGSSYRSPGARMLITDDGKWVGSISGGCLEGDALRKARQVMVEKTPMVVTYDTREESNQNLGIGLGCNGVIDVLIEPINPADNTNSIQTFEKFILSNEPVALATIFNHHSVRGSKKNCCISSMLYINSEGYTDHPHLDATLLEHIRRDLIQLYTSNNSETKKYYMDDNVYEVFIELIQPVISLIIFGAGFDARPVSAIAKSLGWNVSVTDECVAHIAPAFFPASDNLKLCDRSFIDRDFTITAHTACVLMSHNYDYDRDVLRKIAHSDTPYIGILGPRKRFDKMLEEFADSDLNLSEKTLMKIHSPIGLDIGAETPDEIAISIIAEIQTKFTNRGGGFLKYRKGPIHQRHGGTDLVFKAIYRPVDLKEV